MTVRRPLVLVALTCAAIAGVVAYSIVGAESPASAASAQAAVAQAPAAARTPDVIFVPTPEAVVDRMLAMAKVTANDVVYDLGCGDGRIVIAAAKLGARGVGIDIDPQRIKEANENAKKAGVADKVRFMETDLFTTDISSATVVTLYLLPTLNVKLMPKLMKELKPGTRIVSHAFDMGTTWPAEQTDDVDGRSVFYWTIPKSAPAH
jgi:precorrin-6B methylase 2